MRAKQAQTEQESVGLLLVEPIVVFGSVSVDGKGVQQSQKRPNVDMQQQWQWVQ
jgi:hypothetical protein